MAEPTEQELADLLQTPNGFQNVTRRLEQEVTPKPDPFQAAYDEINRLTEESFQAILDSPIGDQNRLLATSQLSAAATSARQSVDIAKDPIKGFGGQELVSVFEQQQNSDFPVDSETFSRRIKLAGILQGAMPEKFNEMIEKREKLNAPDRDLFDRAFEMEFGAFVEDEFSGTPTLRSGSEERFDSPRQQQLWEDFWGDVTPKSGPMADQGEVQEAYLREVKGDEWVDSNLNPQIKFERNLADARKFAAGKFGEAIKLSYQASINAQEIIGGAALFVPKEALEAATGKELPSPTVASIIEVATGKDAQQQAEFAGKLAESIADETLRPEMIFLIAISAGLYASGVGAPGGAAVQGNVVRTIGARVVTNAMIGGFTNAGAEWARNDQANLRSLADDFVIGAFVEATIPELMVAYAATRGGKYNKQAVIEALEATKSKSKTIANIGESNTIVLDSAPRAATLADVGVSNISPNGTAQLSDELASSVDESYKLAIDSQTNAGRLAQEAAELERRYASQGKLRDSVRRAAAGTSGPVQGAEELVTDNMLMMARERAARAAATARNSAKTLNSLINAAELRAHEKLVQAGRAQQGLDLGVQLKPDPEGIITLTGDEPFFRGIDVQYATRENPLATPRRGVNITPTRQVAEQFAERNTTTGQAIDGQVKDVRTKKGARVLAADGASHDRLMEKIVNDPAYQAVPVGQKQQWRDDYMEKAGYDGVLIYKQGLPVLRMFDAKNVKISQTANENFAEITRVAQQVDNEVNEQARTVNTLLNDLRDPTQSPYALRRLGHYISASISGRLPGRMQFVADAAINMRRSLDELTNGVVENLGNTADTLLRKEINTLRYIGPPQWKKWIDSGFKREIFLSRPDLFAGASPELTTTLRKAQQLGDAKVQQLLKNGYKIDAIEGYYFPQFWQNDPKSVNSALRGKVSTAKERLYGDVIEGLENGLTPKNLSIRDTLVAHDKMLNQAFGDQTFRDTMLRRGLAKPGKASVAAGKFEYDSPLFKGLVGDRAVVQATDSYFNVPPTAVSNVRTIAERVKNTSFGLFDLGVFGIQGASAIMKGGWLAVLGELTDSIMIRAIPGAARYDNEAETFWKVLYSRNGGVLGSVSSGYDVEAGTIIGALPLDGLKKVDKFVTEQYMDRLSRLQFDTALTPVRLSIFKGHLFIQHLLRQNINDPKVLRAAAEAANRATLTSRGAQTATRRSLESGILTSAQSARAELANIVSPLKPLADLVTTGKLNGAEAVTAYVALAHMATMYYGIQWTVDEILGQPHDFFNPMEKETWKKFGYVRVGNKEIALIKERSILKAMEQSFEGLMDQDPEYVAEVWSKVFVGKLSPGVSALASLGTGYGYDEQGFFQTGELGTRSKLLNFVPFPLAAEKFFFQPEFRSDPVAMSLEFFGYNNYDLGVIDRRDEFLKTHNPYEPQDPRHADVQANGFAGMERAEAQIFRQEHPEFFSGKNNLDSDERALFERADEIRTNLLELENAVRVDPFMRREYKTRREDLVAELGTLFSGRKSKDVTLQDKALSVYYDTINQFKSQQPGDSFYGDDFGQAEEAARTIISAAYGEEGIAALDRALVIGSTSLETEYRTARRTIADSGYYDIADAVVAAKSGGTWPTYRDFRESLEEFAKEKGVVAEQLPSFRDMDSLISDAKEKFRERNPNIDAQLVIWDGLTPRSLESQAQASKVLGRQVEVAKDVQTKLNKIKESASNTVNFDDIINRFR